MIVYSEWIRTYVPLPRWWYNIDANQLNSAIFHVILIEFLKFHLDWIGLRNESVEPAITRCDGESGLMDFNNNKSKWGK